MSDEDVIEKAAILVGAKMFASKIRPNRKPMYGIAFGGDRAVDIMKIVAPLMGKRRKAKIQEVLESAKSQPGRVRKGSQNGNSKLKEEWIPLIRELYKRGVRQSELARICGASFSSIHMVVRGQTWTHVK